MFGRRHTDDTDGTGDTVQERTRMGMGGGFVRVSAVILGVVAIVLGMYALLRSGLDTTDLSQPRQRTFGVETTPLLSLCSIGLGVFLLLGATGARVGRVILGLSCALL